MHLLPARTHRVSLGCGPIARDKCEPGSWVARLRAQGGRYLDLKKVLWRAVQLLERLGARIG
jgi:hypothetical protein